MSDYKSCGNCVNRLCAKEQERDNILLEVCCSDWERIPCPLCGGTLSEIRESNGKKYRHCYSCHMEQEVKE